MKALIDASSVAVLATTLLVTASTTQAFSGGLVGFSGKNSVFCDSCHMGGLDPTVAFEAPDGTQLAPGAIATFRFRVTSSRSQQDEAGFNVAASGGMLGVAEPGTRAQVVQGLPEIVHSSPRDNDANREAVFTFTWTAPMNPGSYTLFGAGNSVNGNGAQTGDNAATATLLIEVVGGDPITPSPVATATRTTTHSPTRSPTNSPTQTPTRTLTNSPTRTPTRSPTNSPTRSVTNTATSAPTRTPTPTHTIANSPTRTPTATHTAADSPTPASTTIPPTQTATPPLTASPTVSVTSIPSATATLTEPPTQTPTGTAAVTGPPTATATDSPTPTAQSTATDTPTSTATATATASPDDACVGDCDGSGEVTVDEIVRGVNIALGNATVDTCPSLDTNGDGMATVDELVTAIQNALRGC